MKEDEDNKYEGGGLKGPLYWLAGVATAAVAGQNGLLGGILGAPRPNGGDAPVSERVLALTTENQALKSQLYANDLNTKQSVWNATQQGRIDCIQRQVDELFKMTQLSIPNANLNPGYGNAVVTVAPPPPPPDVAGLANAIAAAMQKTTASSNG